MNLKLIDKASDRLHFLFNILLPTIKFNKDKTDFGYTYSKFLFTFPTKFNIILTQTNINSNLIMKISLLGLGIEFNITTYEEIS